MRVLIGLLAVVSLPVLGQVEIERPWIRATPPGIQIAAGYVVVRNKSGSPERLLAAASPAAARVETHVHIKDGEVLRMREVKGYDIPANGTLELKPGGAHLMLVDIKQPFKEGERVPVTLRFERAGEVKVEFPVGGLAGPPVQHKH
jgi:periplasmic copper chaperone A